MVNKIKRSIEYDISADDNASNVFKGVHNNAQSSLGGIAGIASTAGTALVALGSAAVAGGGLIGGFALKAGDEIERSLLKFETLLGSAEEAQQRMNELTEFAALTPFELDDITKADIILEGFGIRSEKTLETIGNAAAISGSNFAELGLIFGQLSQDKSLENIRQLVDRGVVSFNEVEEAGIKFAKDRSIINSVEETYSAVVGIVEEKFAGGMDRLSNTASGKLSNLKDTFTLTLANLSQESGLIDFAKDTLDFLNDKLPVALEVGGELFGKLTDKIKDMTAGFTEDLPGIRDSLSQWMDENEDIIETGTESIKDTFASSWEFVSGVVKAGADAWNNDFLYIQTGLSALSWTPGGGAARIVYR